MQTTVFEHVQKRSKRVVVVHDVPVARYLSDGSAGFSMDISLRLEKLVKDALLLDSQRVELWFNSKSRASPKAA